MTRVMAVSMTGTGSATGQCLGGAPSKPPSSAAGGLDDGPAGVG